MQDKLNDLEMKIAFQERTIEELNGVVLDQSKRLDQLDMKLENLIKKVESEPAVRDQSEEEPPPHY